MQTEKEEMINRELIRTKVVQLVYAYYQNGDKTILSVEKELEYSLGKAYDLYHMLLGIIPAVTKEERHRTDIAAARAAREGRQAPSYKFVDNRLAAQISANEALSEFRAKQRLGWEDRMDFVRKLCVLVEQSGEYSEYMASGESSYEEDHMLWRKLYRRFVVGNEDLDEALEEMSLYWNDDKAIVDTFVLKTIRKFGPDSVPGQELMPMYKDETDKDYARKLLRASIQNAAEYQGYMTDASQNWDFSRLAYMDIVIMQTAIAEMLTFPNIPAPVSINEYVSLAKLFSTPKSGGYTNGMLDTIARHLVDTGRMFKTLEAQGGKGEAAEGND